MQPSGHTVDDGDDDDTKLMQKPPNSIKSRDTFLRVEKSKNKDERTYPQTRSRKTQKQKRGPL